MNFPLVEFLVRGDLRVLCRWSPAPQCHPLDMYIHPSTFQKGIQAYDQHVSGSSFFPLLPREKAGCANAALVFLT